MTIKSDWSPCPNCDQGEMVAFYEARNIPVHSVELIHDLDTALKYPRRDLVLAFCAVCGFIGNTAFDPSVLEYSSQYEATQEFSPTFNTFARSLAKRLVDDYHLQGKRVLEIGCGKGEFVTLLCELGMGEGVGVDPAYVPGRVKSTAGDRVRFIQEFYGAHSTYPAADLICCRHTLEHIASPRLFLQMLRKNIGSNSETLVFFEVPETLRILNELAFWDIYYEHCSYFTEESLARVFRETGFELLELQREFDGQYLTILARPSANLRPVNQTTNHDIDSTAAAVHKFENDVPGIVRYWSDCINDRFQKGQRTVLWGSGSKSVGFITALSTDVGPEFVVDVNPNKHDKYMPGVRQQIVSPDFLKKYRPDTVVLMNPAYLEEVRRDLIGMGLEPEILTLGTCNGSHLCEPPLLR